MAMRTWVAKNPEAYAGQKVDNGHCVRFLQVAASVPHTSQWRRGERVRDATDMPVGTCIATFHDTGHHYENDTTGKSHAAILIAVHSDGILAWDQWVGHPVAQRVIRWRQGASDKVNDGDAFHAIVTEQNDA
jgi:hypothetical protein